MKNKFVIEKCRDCGKEFEKKKSSKQHLCCSCKKIHDKSHNIKTYKQIIICKKCGDVIDIVDKKMTKFVPILKSQRICKKCKNSSMYDKKIQKIICKKCGKIIEEKLKNNTYQLKDHYKYCDECRKKRFEELKIEYSNRMKSNNPMKNEVCKIKAKNTIRRKIKNNELKYKRGKEHHLYKKGENLYNVCRDYLYQSWAIPIMERDEFRCVYCGDNKNLQVHHIRPFIQILRKIMAMYNILD